MTRAVSLLFRLAPPPPPPLPLPLPLPLLMLAAAGPARAQDGAANDWRPPDLVDAVASFGAAVHDGAPYVYGGHVELVHAHSIENISPGFLRLAETALRTEASSDRCETDVSLSRSSMGEVSLCSAGCCISTRRRSASDSGPRSSGRLRPFSPRRQ